MTMVHTDFKRLIVDAACLPHPGLADDDDRLDSPNADPFRDAEASEIVHDFRNTLAAITMLSEFMLKELPEASPVRGVARDVRLACNDALALCGRMLASSRGTCGSAERIDLSNLVTEMAALLETCVPPPSALRFDLAADLPSLDFAPVAMRQIVMNLVRNAAEALSDRPGNVTVSTGWIELDAARLREENGLGALRPGRHVCLAVSDTGCGIDEPTRFRLLEGSFSTKTNGHGLGLASVHRIAAGHGAGILLDSQVGAGTTVRVVFAGGSPSASIHP